MFGPLKVSFTTGPPQTITLCYHLMLITPPCNSHLGGLLIYDQDVGLMFAWQT